MRGERYFTGKPCLRGHISERSLSNRGCLACHREDMAKRQKENPAHARHLDKLSRDRNPHHTLRGLKDYHAPEKWQEVLEYYKVKNHARRGAPGRLSPDIRKVLFDMQKGTCNGCNTTLDQFAHLDHILAISRGGANTDDNVQLLCPRCNLSKGAKTMEEWKYAPNAR